MTCLIAAPAFAGPYDVLDTAKDLFDRLPDVQERMDFRDQCGIGPLSNSHVGYCTTQNMIFVADGFEERPFAAYEIAHLLGHAIQVRHGVADVALRTIRNRPNDEAALRGMVTRQVECVAGVLMAKAEEPAVDFAQFTDEPFTDAHWGRAPLNLGPRVSIGTQARMEWYHIGYDAQDFSVCSVGEMSSELIVDALR